MLLASSAEISGLRLMKVTSSLITPMPPSGSDMDIAKAGSHWPAAPLMKNVNW
jgi:hypothetical protein